MASVGRGITRRHQETPGPAVVIARAHTGTGVTYIGWDGPVISAGVVQEPRKLGSPGRTRYRSSRGARVAEHAPNLLSRLEVDRRRELRTRPGPPLRCQGHPGGPRCDGFGSPSGAPAAIHHFLEEWRAIWRKYLSFDARQERIDCSCCSRLRRVLTCHRISLGRAGPRSGMTGTTALSLGRRQWAS